VGTRPSFSANPWIAVNISSLLIAFSPLETVIAQAASAGIFQTHFCLCVDMIFWNLRVTALGLDSPIPAISRDYGDYPIFLSLRYL
jgi:hypothetical protein